MKYFYILFLAFAFYTSNAQEFQKVYEHNIDHSFKNLFKGQTTDVEISPSGDYVMMLTEDYVKTLNKNGKVIFEYKCVPKTESNTSLVSDLIGGQIGSMISNIKLDEGNGFWLFEEENLIIVLDWNLDQNLIIGYDLSTGKKLWELDRYRYTPGKDKQLSLVLAATAVSAVASQSFSIGTSMAQEAFSSVHTDFVSRRGVGSERANAFITPLPGTDDFLLTQKDGITSINKKTGAENWTYDKRPVKIGEVEVLSDYNDIMLVNFNPKAITDSKTNFSPNYFVKQGYVLRLDVDSGEELAKVDFKGSFAPDRFYIKENMYILDYFGAEAYDLESNEMLYETISQEMYEEDREIKAVKLRKDYIMPTKSWLDEDNIYYLRSDFTTTKRRIYAHDIKTGKLLWKTDELDDSAGIVDLTDEKLIIKEFGVGKNFFTNIDKSTGEILAGPVKVKQTILADDRKPWLFTSEDHIVHNGKRLYFLDKESLEEEKEIKLKKAKIGDVYAMDLLPAGLIMIGEKGVAFYDRSGNFQKNIKINNVERGLWTEDYMLVITKGNLFKPGNIHMINIDNQKEVDVIQISDLTVFSPDLDHVIKGNSDKDTQLEFFSIKD